MPVRKGAPNAHYTPFEPLLPDGQEAPGNFYVQNIAFATPTENGGAEITFVDGTRIIDQRSPLLLSSAVGEGIIQAHRNVALNPGVLDIGAACYVPVPKDSPHPFWSEIHVKGNPDLKVRVPASPEDIRVLMSGGAISPVPHRLPNFLDDAGSPTHPGFFPHVPKPGHEGPV